jgi:AAA+ superfamily predicted ATPase
MISQEPCNWCDENKSYLMSRLETIRRSLEEHANSPENTANGQEISQCAPEKLSSSAPFSLDTLCGIFGLTPFERDILLLCAGMELDSKFPMLCAAASGDPKRAYPTFSLALSVLPGAHWSALSPGSPLRQWRLIEIGTGNSLTYSLLHIDERVLHYLVGVLAPDERLAGILEVFYNDDIIGPVHNEIAGSIARTWSKIRQVQAFPVVQLCGDDIEIKRLIAQSACRSLGYSLCAINTNSLPQTAGEVSSFIRLCERESVLGGYVMFLDCEEVDNQDTNKEKIIDRLIVGLRCPLVIASRNRRMIRQRSLITYDVPRLTSSEQLQLWKSSMGPLSLSIDGKVNALVSQFDLSSHSIKNACAKATGYFADRNTDPEELYAVLWDTCLREGRTRLESMSVRIEPSAKWDDLVLPEPQRRILTEIAMHVRQRKKVYDSWGFSKKGTRGLGISVLFAGESGTGKTMAAEVLANELRLDLYRIDLSQVVSKYIGETEKNLRRVFDAAEEGGAILLFDEADALFGKRTEVKDSHDRFANIEVSYLLQRMEAYRGLAILTTNMKNALDSAFLRRIRFIVQFPFPDHVARAGIWQKIFPRDTPIEGLDMNKLARLNVAGGNIKNIAMNAAFLAADEDVPVRMTHILKASRSECSKMEKTLTDSEVHGWI